MARTPYQDAEAEGTYQDINKGSSKPSAPDYDEDLRDQNTMEREIKKPFRYDRPVRG